MKKSLLKFVLGLVALGQIDTLKANQSFEQKMSQEVLDITQANFNEVISSSSFVVIDVYTDWCGPCKRFGPIFHETASELGHMYRFCKINAEFEEELRQELNVTGVPTILFFKDGEEVGRHVGAPQKEKLKALLNKHFAE